MNEEKKCNKAEKLQKPKWKQPIFQKNSDQEKNILYNSKKSCSFANNIVWMDSRVENVYWVPTFKITIELVRRHKSYLDIRREYVLLLLRSLSA